MLPIRKPTLRVAWYISTSHASEHTRSNWNNKHQRFEHISSYGRGIMLLVSVETLDDLYRSEVA